MENEISLNEEDKQFLDFAVDATEKGYRLSFSLQRRLIHLLHQMHNKSLRVERDKMAEKNIRVIIFEPPKGNQKSLKNFQLVEWMGLKDN